jgi:hypothetical protein
MKTITCSLSTCKINQSFIQRCCWCFNSLGLLAFGNSITMPLGRHRRHEKGCSHLSRPNLPFIIFETRKHLQKEVVPIPQISSSIDYPPVVKPLQITPLLILSLHAKNDVLEEDKEADDSSVEHEEHTPPDLASQLLRCPVNEEPC